MAAFMAHLRVSGCEAYDYSLHIIIIQYNILQVNRKIIGDVNFVNSVD